MAFAVPARVLMQDAPKLLAAGLLAVRGGETEIDLSAVRECDSSLLACLLAWRREAAAPGAALVVLEAPMQIRRIAELYGVASLALG